MAVALKKRLGEVAAGAAAAGAAWLALAEMGVLEMIGLGYAKWLWAAVLLGIIAALLDRLRWIVWPAVTVLVLLLGVEWLPGLASQARGYVRTDPIPTDGVDAVVVLSAGIRNDGRINGIAVDRLLEGIRLARTGAAGRLVLTRTFTTVGRDTVTSDRDQRAILASAGYTGDLRILGPVGTTRLEAERTLELATREGWKRVIVVTSPIHTRRACAAFETVGLLVTCRPSPERAFALDRLGAPHDRTVAISQMLYETLGWWKYRVGGWISAPRTR